MSWIMAFSLGICMIIAVSGAVAVVIMRVEARSERQKQSEGGASDSLEARVAELERRLTDTQDVVISLNEKLEAMEPASVAGSRG